MSDVMEHADGRVELNDPKQLESSPLYNHDLAPVAVKDRTWNTWDFSALWISMAHCIPTYTLASGMIVAGMAWWQALVTILLGNLIVLAPILLNSHPGTKYGIPFPVFARAAYGTVGANVPAILRAIVACGWFGINTWLGGEALQGFLDTVWPGWADLIGTTHFAWHGHGKAVFENTQWISFALFWLMNIAIIFRGMDLLRRIERFAAPYVLIMTALLVGWAIHEAGGLGPLISQMSFHGEGSFSTIFITSLTGTIAFWSTLSLNMPDFTRFGRSQREQVIGQTVALPTTMTVFAAMAILITSASVTIFKGTAVGDPLAIVTKGFTSKLIVAIAMFTAVIATLAVNIAANVVSPANDFANAFPKKIDFKRGGLITGVIGILMMPWQMLASFDAYVGKWMGSYGAALGSVAGVLIVDYWVIRKKVLDLPALYTPTGAYTYKRGWNPAAIIATAAGFAIALLGAFWPPLAVIYHWSWFVGFGVSAALYWLLMSRMRQ
ncbi:MAG: NCS1 family nucleobase:cation symporter-1 [Kofleriaceae bacterium]